ncbi:FAD-binding and (Fe-S)-binding domain-containing protein [Streptomyces capparidis]
MPVVRRERAPEVDTRGLERELRRRVDGEVRFDRGSRAVYSTDASNYRQVPLCVVLPRTVDAAVAAVAVCREYAAPVLSRGGGTSLAGQCCNTGVVIDWSKYCHRLVSVDPGRRRCVAEPGLVLDELNRALAGHRLQFGPRPSTHANCTVGGMVGNNACGATAQAYGKVADNVSRLEVLTYDGTRMWVGRTDPREWARRCAEPGRAGEIHRGLAALRDAYGDLVRRRFPRIPRRVSGYNLDALLPDAGPDLAALLVGSESTLVTVLRAELELVPVPEHLSLVVLGFPDVATAGDHVPAVVRHRPHALEGIDDRLVGFESGSRLNPEGLALLPEGRAWLMVQFAGQDRDEARDRARALLDDPPGGATAARYDDPERERELWTVRESGLAATAHVPGMPDTWEGWEDSAVAPERLGDYLRDLKALLAESGYGEPSLYGHFGQGCVHTRIPFDLASPRGVARTREFLERAADLVARYGGSLSGEHGDGQARGELLTRMFGPELVEAFGRLKALFDPDDRMNPGKVVAPYRLDENLRLRAGHDPWEPPTAFAYPRDDGRFSRAAGRCVGVGKCRSLQGGVMCPSYRATLEEEHSTRGRARLLFEMVRGDSPVRDGWRSTEVRDALDLCLACKGCAKDCPVGVDMATYKAEFLHHHYAGRPRPAAHWSMGWLPLWARGATRAAGPVNAVTHAGLPGRAVRRLAGVDPAREIPVFAGEPFTRWWASRGGTRGGGRRGEVLLWPDTWTNAFQPAVGRAAVEVLEAAGFHVRVPRRPVCCGLTWISTGQLGVARRVLRRTLRVLDDDLRVLDDDLRRGVPVAVLEPSCAAVFRGDLPNLLPGDAGARRLTARTHTLAELLTARAPDWAPPPVDATALVQRHCHQHAVLGFDADRALLDRAGLRARVLDAGCCGLAGDFGFVRGHREVSAACAEHALLPAVRAAGDGALVVADGFSCRTQVEQLGPGAVPVHLAEVLAAGLRGRVPRAERPPRPSRAATATATAAAAAPVGAAAAAAVALAGGRRAAGGR